MNFHRPAFSVLFVAMSLALAGCGSGGDGNGHGLLDGGQQDGDPNGGMDAGDNGGDTDAGDNGGDTDAGDNGGDTDAGDNGGDADAGDNGGDADAGDNGGDTDAGDTDAGGIEIPGPDGGTVICYPAPCDGEIRECGDCIDNDGDGLIDDQDPNCLGPCDNNESGFDLQIDGQPLAPCNRDCYYDSDSGWGNDNCRWPLQCDPLEPVSRCDGECQYDEDFNTEENNPVCHEVCGPLTPAGCDCFGCCDIRTDADPDQENWIFIGSHDEDRVGTCDMDAAKAGDHEACRPCTPTDACWNPCTHECQLCLGRTVDDLPDHCFPSDDPDPEPDAGVDAGMDAGTDAGTDGGTEDDRCDHGQQPCGLPGDDPCPEFHFCLTGCCIYAG